MNKLLILAVSLLVVSFAANAQYDDIYYNPKNDKSQKGVTKKNSYYVPDFGNVDVDAYNRRGETYYTSPVDTVGVCAATGEDFVYTRQIQKFYNPTIVVDNAELLSEVLNNSYGNIDVVYEGNMPIFVAPSRFSFSWPYYSYVWNYGNPWYWGPSFSYNWGWGPSWSWGYNYPWWGWDYPWWGGWRPPYHNHQWVSNHYRPNGNNTVGARPGWQNSSRPAVNGNRRPAAGYPNAGRPQSGVSRPETGSHVNGYSYNNRRGSGTSRPQNYTGKDVNSSSGKVTTFGSGNYNRYSGNTNGSVRNNSIRNKNNNSDSRNSSYNNKNYNRNSYRSNNNTVGNRNSGGYRSGGSGAGRVGGGGHRR